MPIGSPERSSAQPPHPSRPRHRAGLWAAPGKFHLQTLGCTSESGLRGLELGSSSKAPRSLAPLKRLGHLNCTGDTKRGAVDPEVAGGDRVYRVGGRLPPPGSRRNCAAPACRADTRRAASGATGAAGGVSLALCGRRRNSLCPFLAATATRCPLHVDEAAPGAVSFPPPAALGLAWAPPGVRRPLGRPRVGRGLGSGPDLCAEHRDASVEVQGVWRTRGDLRSQGRGPCGVGTTLGGYALGTGRGRPPGEASAFSACSGRVGILGAFSLPPQRRIQLPALLKEPRGEWDRVWGEAAEL